jgi:fluoride exporter
MPRAVRPTRPARLRRPVGPFAPVRGRPRHGPATRLPTLLAVAAGGAVGGTARYGVGLLLPTAARGLPWATFSVNVAGAFLLGLLLVLVHEVWPPTHYLRPLLGVGLLGSLTTFSTWMVEVDRLLVHDAAGTAVAYLAGSVLAGLAATVLGVVLGRAVAAGRTRARRQHADAGRQA